MMPVVNQEPKQISSFAFQGWPLGLNTSVPETMLSPKELSECVDLKIQAGGQLKTREAVIKMSTVAITNDVYHMAYAVIDGTGRDILSGSDGKIYYMNSTVPTLIGTAAGKSYLFAYNDACMVCDGSYLKYVDDVSKLKMAYDAGTGYQFDNYTGDQDSVINLNANNTRAGVKFETDAWDAGFTMPPTEVEFFISRTGSPSGTIACKIRKESDDSVIATKDVSIDAGGISVDGEFVTVYFLPADVTTEMSPETKYYASVEFSSGDASNYLSIACTDETGYAMTYNAGWSRTSTKNPVMKVYPGLPPKTTFGCVSGARPYFSGDPDNPGYVWYGNVTHLDFSTTDGGGYISVIDDSRNSFEVGGLQGLYGELYVFGTQDQPFLCKLSGATPSEYALPLLFQRAWTTQMAMANTVNDLWFGSGDGVNALSGVQEYGDVRTFSESDRVKDKLEDNWVSTTAFSGYYGKDGQYWLHLPTLGKTLVCHTKIDSHPWVEYDLPIAPTSFGQLSTGFSMGGDDGFVYQFSDTEYKDLASDQIEPVFSTSYIELPLSLANFTDFQVIGKSTYGGKIDISFYKDGMKSTPHHTYLVLFPVFDGLTLGDMDMDVEDAVFSFNPSAKTLYVKTNITAWSFMLRAEITHIISEPVYINGLILKYRNLEV